MCVAVLACSEPEEAVGPTTPSTSSPAPPEPAPPSDTSSGATTGDTGDPGEPPVSCDGVADPTSMMSMPIAEEDLQYEERADGLQWIAGSWLIAESAGYTPDTVVVRTSDAVWALRGDAAGNLYWIEGVPNVDMVLWWKPAGQPPAALHDLGTTTYDLDLHPSGAVVTSTGTGIVWVDPVTGDAEHVPVPAPWVTAVAYDLTGDHLWVAHAAGVDLVAVEPDGRLASGAVPVPVIRNGRTYQKLAVDACGRVYGIRNQSWTGFGWSRLDRWDVSGTVVEIPGRFDQIGPGLPLHFGRAPDERTWLTTSTTTYHTTQPLLVGWDLGVGARP